MTATEPAPSPAADRTGGTRAYVELLRLPAVFTAMADVAMGFLFTHSNLQPWPVFGAVVAFWSLTWPACAQ